MELASERFVDAIRKVLADDRPALASVHARPHPVIDALRVDHEVIEITVSNRDRLAEELTDRLARHLREE